VPKVAVSFSVLVAVTDEVVTVNVPVVEPSATLTVARLQTVVPHPRAWPPRPTCTVVGEKLRLATVGAETVKEPFAVVEVNRVTGFLLPAPWACMALNALILDSEASNAGRNPQSAGRRL
jgi:hypothetical protein